MPNLAKLKIGDFVLDPSRDVLIGAEGETALERKVVEVLLTLAASPNQALSRDELIEAVWKTEFGADERLTRAISLLRKAFGDERGAARYIETVTKRGYRLVAPVHAMPLLEGARLENAAQASETGSEPAGAQGKLARPQSPRSWQAYALVAGLVAAIGAAGIVSTLWRDPGSPDDAHARGAVELLPFVLIEGKPGLDAFARQVHASLKRIMASNRVSLIDGTAKPQVEGSGAPLEETEFILTGSLERIDDQYAVTLYFDAREDGQTLWSRRFTRPFADAEGLREEIGANAAGVIGCGLNQRADANTKPATPAFKIYLELCEPTLWKDRGELALAATRRLTTIAPEDAYGHGMAAIVNGIVAIERPDLSKTQVEFYRIAANKAATRAFELDPASPYARLTKTMMLPGADYWLGFDAFVARVGADNPMVRGSVLYNASLRQSGRLKDALHLVEQEVARLPLSANDKTTLAVMNMQVGNHEAAARLLEQTLKLWPNHQTAHWYYFVNEAFYGDSETALRLLGDKAEALDLGPGERDCWQRFIAARARGANAEDHAVIRQLCARGDESNQDYGARMLSALSDIDGAYELLERHSFEWRGSTTFLFYPEMALFRKDARFMPLIAPSGLLDYWTKSGQWPDFCADDTLPYDCKTEAERALKDKKRAVSVVPPS